MAVIFQNFRGVQYDNGETLQGVFCVAAPSVVYATGSVNASTDPFSAKTTKYAESKIIVISATAAVHVKFSAAGTAALITDYYIPANMLVPFVIASGLEYVRVIPFTGSASIWVTEIY